MRSLAVTTRIQLERRYSLLTVAYLGIIYWLSSVSGFGAPERHPLVLLVSNLAHAPLFAGLAFCVLKSLSGERDVWWEGYGLAFVVSGACAVLDEWHQSFVPGRDSAVVDLLTDLVGIAAMLLVLRIHGLRKDRRRAGDIAFWAPLVISPPLRSTPLPATGHIDLPRRILAGADQITSRRGGK